MPELIDLGFFSGLPVAVLGLGRSGLTAARALQASGAEVWAWDDNPDRRREAEAEGVRPIDLTTCDWQQLTSLVISPGIPHTHPAPHPVAALARQHGCEIIGDIELLARSQRDTSYIGITGTNGKSTATALIGHILEFSGRSVAVGGNLGMPALALESLDSSGIYVIEMSSYQLEITVSITFDVAVLLNLSADHLERHGGWEGYIAAKRQIFHRQTKPRSAVIGVDDDHCREIHRQLIADDEQNVVAISGQREVAGGVYVVDGVLYDDTQGGKVQALDLRNIATLPGAHNWQNAAAAYAACRSIGVDPAVTAACIRSFAGLAHRQELIAVIDGVAFVNDSKATNDDAAAKALTCYPAIYWIAGGRGKQGADFVPLLDNLARVEQAYLIGEAEAALAAALDGKVVCQRCGTLDKAVAAATAQARADGRRGAVVLLSPACASFDHYVDFEARGEDFRALVEALPGERVELDPSDWTLDAGEDPA